MNSYDIIIRYYDQTPDQAGDVEHATEASLMDFIRRCLSHASVERFEIVKTEG